MKLVYELVRINHSPACSATAARTGTGGGRRAGIVTPMVVGFAVGGTGSFGGALSFIAALALLGVASYLFVLGSVHRLVIAD